MPMSRFAPSSLLLSLLPVGAVVGVLCLNMPARPAEAVEAEALVLYLPPSPATDPIHVRQLARLRQTIGEYDRRAARMSAPRPSHDGLAAQYRLIVRETTPAAVRRAGLPFDVR